jgi:hypothetical protein
MHDPVVLLHESRVDLSHVADDSDQIIEIRQFVKKGHAAEPGASSSSIGASRLRTREES